LNTRCADKLKWIKIKSSTPKARYLKLDEPVKAKADYYYMKGKLKGETIIPPVTLFMQYNDDKNTRVRLLMTTWKEGHFTFMDGLPPPVQD
jgi:hypothetical protein